MRNTSNTRSAVTVAFFALLNARSRLALLR